MSYPKVQVHADSMGAGMAALLATPTRLNCPVYNSATGGDSIQTILTGVQRTGMGAYNYFRGGHQEELRNGRVQFILDTTAQIVDCSPGRTMVLQQGINVEAAYQKPGYERVAGWIEQITQAWADAYGPLYFPVRDRMLTQASKRAGLTAQDREDISRKLLPAFWRAPRGNSGHMNDAGKRVCANIIARYTRSLGTWPVGPA